MKYQMVLWDFDGTLAYTGRDVWITLEHAAAKCGGRLPKEFTGRDSNLGKTVKEVFHQIIPKPEEEKYEMFEEVVRVHYRTLNEYQNTYLDPGIRQLLLKTRAAGMIHFIITMKPQEALEKILKQKDWKVLFDGWISPDSFPGAERTKSEMITDVMRKSGLEASQYVYIGDTWSDVDAACENGIDCIGVTYGDGDTKQLCARKPKYCAQDVSEIEKIIKEGV